MKILQVDDEQFTEIVTMVREMHKHILGRPSHQDTMEYLTVTEVADALDVSDNTIYRAIYKGVLKRNEENRLSPIDVNRALKHKTLRCDARYAEEFRKTYIY